MTNRRLKITSRMLSAKTDTSSRRASVSGRALRTSVLAVMFSLFALSPAHALVELEDEVLTGVTGDGLTFAWTDFRMMFSPESYFELVGSAGSNTCTGTGASSGNYNCWRRGDLRWYGLNVSAEGTAVGQTLTGGVWNTTWTETGGNMTQCASAGVAGLGCPRGGPVSLFAAHDNPYILRVQSYAGDGSAATSIGNGIVTYQGNNAAANWPTGSGQTVLEWLAPAWNRTTLVGQDDYRYSAWGEIEVGRGGTGTGLLKSQTIISGNSAGSVLRFWKFTQTSTSPGAAAAFNPLTGAAGCTNAGCANVDAAGSSYNNRSLALEYQSWLRGDFRFSVAQTEAAPVIGVPVVFHSTEGLYFRNSEVFMPLGQPFYQALTINVPRNTGTNAPVTDGNFTLEIPILPNRTAVFTRFYSLNTTPGTGTASVEQAYDYGYATARSALLRQAALTNDAINYMPDGDITTAPFPTNYPAPNANYYKTHGFARWGDWYTCNGVSCILPLSPNSVAEADAGTGRNSWRSDGDGTFFKNIASYNAYSYRTWRVDVSNNPSIGNPVDSDTYTSITYMANLGACDAVGAANDETCGYGGDYRAASDFGSPVSSQNIVPPDNSWNKTALGGAVARNVVVVPANGTLNIGDSRIEGLQIQFMRLTTYGANF